MNIGVWGKQGLQHLLLIVYPKFSAVSSDSSLLDSVGKGK